MYKQDRAQRRQKRSRGKMEGTRDMPRLSVYRSNRHLYAQLIDDVKRVTVLGVSEKDLENAKGNKSEKAKALGVLCAQKAASAKIKKAIFDRGSYQYHGRVKAFAEGLREGGLQI
ncbi:MAG TPA: 50S ribosomal protein L18 [Candidatus Saccharimonadales bacterium]|nr:50S ribosomal protein L18 [Candidatus Saccharimonadales bacterium]